MRLFQIFMGSGAVNLKKVFHRWYTKIPKLGIFKSTLAIWRGRDIIWCPVIVYKYSDSRYNELYYVHNKVDANLFETDFQRIIDQTCYRMCFKFNIKISRQKLDGNTKTGPLSVTFSDIYVSETKSGVEIPSKLRYL